MTWRIAVACRTITSRTITTLESSTKVQKVDRSKSKRPQKRSEPKSPDDIYLEQPKPQEYIPREIIAADYSNFEFDLTEEEKKAFRKYLKRNKFAYENLLGNYSGDFNQWANFIPEPSESPEMVKIQSMLASNGSMNLDQKSKLYNTIRNLLE